MAVFRVSRDPEPDVPVDHTPLHPAQDRVRTHQSWEWAGDRGALGLPKLIGFPEDRRIPQGWRKKVGTNFK